MLSSRELIERPRPKRNRVFPSHIRNRLSIDDMRHDVNQVRQMISSQHEVYTKMNPLFRRVCAKKAATGQISETSEHVDSNRPAVQVRAQKSASRVALAFSTSNSSTTSVASAVAVFPCDTIVTDTFSSVSVHPPAALSTDQKETPSSLISTANITTESVQQTQSSDISHTMIDDTSNTHKEFPCELLESHQTQVVVQPPPPLVQTPSKIRLEKEMCGPQFDSRVAILETQLAAARAEAEALNVRLRSAEAVIAERAAFAAASVAQATDIDALIGMVF